MFCHHVPLTQGVRVWLKEEDPTGDLCGHHLLFRGEGKPRQKARGANLSE